MDELHETDTNGFGKNTESPLNPEAKDNVSISGPTSENAINSPVSNDSLYTSATSEMPA